MLLAVDIGNTNIVLGIWNNNELIGKWRLSTDIKKTEDEYRILIEQIIKDRVDLKEIKSSIISSVVPPLDRIFEKMLTKYLNIKPLFVTADINLGIGIKYPNKYEIGADRLVNAAAAVELYEQPNIIIDFGTATTFCYVDKEKYYHGGLILPGVALMLKALHLGTSKLPEIDIKKPEKIIGDSTIESIQAGVFYQTKGAINFIVNMLFQKYGKESRVIITGGFADFFKDDFEFEYIIDSDLTLKGLNVIFHLN
jgi:type III pantothenate kinase